MTVRQYTMYSCMHFMLSMKWVFILNRQTSLETSYATNALQWMVRIDKSVRNDVLGAWLILSGGNWHQQSLVSNPITWMLRDIQNNKSMLMHKKRRLTIAESYSIFNRLTIGFFYGAYGIYGKLLLSPRNIKASTKRV